MPSEEITVLVVEDVAEMGELLSHLLSEIPGVRVSSVASNTAEARLELDRRCPDLIFLDEVLPGESSLDFLEEVVRREVSVFLITGMEEREAPLPTGVLGRLDKPDWKTLEAGRKVFERAIDQAFPDRIKM